MSKQGHAIWMLSGILLSGCASQYQAPVEVPKAELSVMATQTPGNKTTRSVRILALADEKCRLDKNGMLVAREFVLGNPDTVETVPAKIPAAGAPFHFYAEYGDSRFAQNKGCTVQASFTPVAGRKYRGVIIIRGEVSACDFGLYDVTSGAEEPAAFEMPPSRCPGSGLAPVANGKATRTDWRMEFR